MPHPRTRSRSCFYFSRRQRRRLSTSRSYRRRRALSRTASCAESFKKLVPPKKRWRRWAPWRTGADLPSLNPRRQDHHGLPRPLQALLDGERRLVVENPVVPGLVLKNDLADKKGRPPKLARHLQAQLLRLFDHLGADGILGGRGNSDPARQPEVLLEHELGPRLQDVDLLLPLEAARVNHAHGEEHEVPEVTGELAEDAQHRVNSHSPVASHENSRRALPRIRQTWVGNDFLGKVFELSVEHLE